MRSASTATKYSSFCTISSALSYVKSLPVIYWSQVLKRQVGSASLISPYDGLISKWSNSRESDANLKLRTICQKLRKSIHIIKSCNFCEIWWRQKKILLLILTLFFVFNFFNLLNYFWWNRILANSLILRTSLHLFWP